MNRPPESRIVIYRLGSLGDTIAALPCFHKICDEFSTSERLVLTNVPVSAKAAPLEVILRDGGFVDGAIAYPVGMRNPFKLMQLAIRLRRLRSSTLVYLAAPRGISATKRDVRFFRAAGFKRIIGAPLSADLQQNRIDSQGILEPESERLARCLSQLGHIDVLDRAMWNLNLTTGERDAAARCAAPFVGRRFVSVNMGGKAVEKDWGERKWGELLSVLSAAWPSTGLAFVGAGVDVDRATRIRRRWDGPSVNACGQLSPRESAALIEQSSLFIGHDSGPLHAADAVNTPAIGVFGDYNKPNVWHPSGATTRIVHEMRGLDEISVDRIVRVAMDLVPAIKT